MEFIFFARRGLLLERSHVAGGEGEYTTVKTRGLLLLSRELSVMPELCQLVFSPRRVSVYLEV